VGKHLDLSQEKDRPHGGKYLSGCPVCELLEKIRRGEKTPPKKKKEKVE
jgi:hypothetical protein